MNRNLLVALHGNGTYSGNNTIGTLPPKSELAGLENTLFCFYLAAGMAEAISA